MDVKPKKTGVFPLGGRLLIGLTGVSLLLLAMAFWRVSQVINPQEKSPISATSLNPSISQKIVTALGRLSPKDEIIKVSTPSLSEGARVDVLKVEEGDRVRPGEILAILDSRDRYQAILEQSQKEVNVKQAQLAQVKAGAKSGELTAQQSEISKLQAQIFRSTQSAQARLTKSQAKLKREQEVLQAKLTELTAELQREKGIQEAKITQLNAQLKGDITAQKATLERLKVELKNAESEYQRNRDLYETGAISASIYDQKRLIMETAREKVKEAEANLIRMETTLQSQIKEAEGTLKRIIETGNAKLNEAQATLKQTLETGEEDIRENEANLQQTREMGEEQINQAEATFNKIAEIRPTDIQSAEAELARAIAAQKKAETDLSFTYIKAPVSGQVLKIKARPGERVNNQEGILELGRTDQMYVIAEVYETDISKVRSGQPVKIESENGGFQGELSGIVDQIGLRIGKKDVLENDPTADKDARVIEVKIRIDAEDVIRVSGLTNLQVRVKINVDK